MSDFQNEVFAWIEQADNQESPSRQETIRLAIGQALLSKHTDLKQDLAITEAALDKVGLGRMIQPTPQEDILISIQQYTQMRQTLGIENKALCSRLWNGMWQQHRFKQRWPELFDQEGRLNVNKLSGIINRQELFGPKLGDQSRHLAELLVDHMLRDQDTNS